jgi:hypothetical protein
MIRTFKKQMIFILMILLCTAPHTGATCAPDWNPVTYTNSTTAYTLVTVNGQPAAAGDMVGAFVNGECRAVGTVVLSGGNAYATLVIQGTEAETVHFKIWDGSECAVMDSGYTVQTNPGNRLGLPPDYLPVSAENAAKPVLSVNPVSQNISAESGTFTVTVANTGESGMNWTAEVTGGNWLRIQGENNGTDAGTLTLAYDTNSGSERTAVITISSAEAEISPQTLTVKQAAMAVAGENTVSIIPSATTVETGKTFTAEIKISGKGIWAVHAVCNNAPESLELIQKGTYGDFIDPKQRFTIPVVTDTAAGSWTGAQTLKHPVEPVSGEGIFAYNIKYKAMPGAYGETSVTAEIILTDRYGNILPVQVADAVVTIDDGIHGGEGVIEGTITYIDGTPVSGAEVTISVNGKEYTVITDENGHYVLNDLRDLAEGESFTVEAGKEGFYAEAGVDSVENPVSLDMEILNTELADLNKDGTVDIADFTLLANSYGLSEGNEGYDSRADINGDKTVNIQDLALLGSHWKIK